ncbi:MAG: ATPase, T2SS/T4P/T4SS family [bacterium]|nr:ATPase, T2SS/T4P/T4SS family [bacterium]MDZ4299740.1 ATPase, T2SS/T4P/T4SS family [Candidatus Sungbacteria bacterium]
MEKTLIEILIAAKALTLAEAAEVQRDAKERGVALEEVLYARGISENAVIAAKSELTGYPIKSLEGNQIPSEDMHDIPEESARYYKMIPLGKREGYLDVGMLVPDDLTAQEALKFISSRANLPTRVFLVTPTDFGHVMEQYQNLSGEVHTAVGEFERESARLAEAMPVKRETSNRIVDDAPITKIVTVMLRHAVTGHASDIHIEPSREKLRIRFRVDGVLHTTLTMPVNAHASLVTRIKVLASLKIDETRIPQDGRFHLDIDGRGIDFRISTLPTSFGEKVVIRILDPDAGIKTLEDLGFLGSNLDRIVEGIKRPYGMILITGPTGSGKSTTLYGLLQILNKEETNIISLEDPIEYFVEGVNQSQIRPEIGYDFASGLRHILRQDPDIILVGEIRDKETAQLAVHAALTGHLVLTTLHTNGAIGVIPRLIDMGIDPFLIAPTVVLAVGQRLVRRLCPDSRKKTKIEGRANEIIMPDIEQMPAALREKFAANPPQEIYEPEVSPTCPKGTRGRVGINEVLVMTPELEKIILTHPSETDIAAEAKRQGMITMRQDGILKVLDGIIGLEELLETV